ncbi:MAG: MDR family MFS transporter [Tuberibacillus sp.]
MKKTTGALLRLKLHPAAWIIIIGTLLARAGFFMTIPYLGMYLHEVKGMTPATIGAVLSVSFIANTLSGFIGGPLSDRFGRYPVMIGSMLLWTLVFLGFHLADATWLFFLLNGLSGFCRNTFETAAKALLTDVTHSSERNKAFQLRYLAINIGACAGPLVGLQIGTSHSGAAFIVTGSLYFLLALILFGSWLFLSHSGNNQRSTPVQQEKLHFRLVFSILMKDKAFRYITVANFFIYSGYGHLDTTVSQYMGGDEVGMYSLLFMVNGLAILSLQYPLMKWSRRFSSMTSIKLGTLFFGISLLGLGFFHSLPLLVLSIIFFSAGEILCFIIGDVVISDLAPKSMRGLYFGASGLAFLGQSAGAWAGGFLLGLFGYDHGGTVFSILALLTWIAFPFLQWSGCALQKKAFSQTDHDQELANQVS